MEWQPIETAPKDGTVIDLWVFCLTVSDDAFDYSEHRIANAFWGDPSEYFADKQPAQWCMEGVRYGMPINDTVESEEIYCFETGFSLIVATHWMPLPAPPKEE